MRASRPTARRGRFAVGRAGLAAAARITDNMRNHEDFQERLQMTARSGAGPMRCPSCGSRLIEVERSEILIDACPDCRGIWLDRGELDKLLERERRAAQGVVDSDEDFFAEVEGKGAPAEQGHTKQSGAPRRRRLGMLEDLFDFD